GCLFFTALGDDRVAEDARGELERNGVEVHAATREEPTRTALTMIDHAHERTIVTLGDRLEPRAADPLPWERLDAVVGSERDPAERYEPGRIDPPPALVVRTEGTGGGSWETAAGERGRYDAAAPPGPLVDTYGAGDSFQAGLLFGLASGARIEDALALAARCGAAAA